LSSNGGNQSGETKVSPRTPSFNGGTPVAQKGKVSENRRFSVRME
jgi:hypothetical protein